MIPAVGEYVRVDQSFPISQYWDGEFMGTWTYPAGEIAQVVQQEEGHSHVIFLRVPSSAIYRFPNENLKRVRKVVTERWVETND